MRRGALLVAITLSGCAAAAPGPDRGGAPIPYALDSGGVQLSDRPLRIDFGRTEASTLPAMDKLVGRGASGSGDCAAPGTRYVDWPDGTRLVFAENRFLGWQTADGRAGRTCGGAVPRS